MRFALFYHSVVSDWNHGNVHFLRGLVRNLVALGHEVICYERPDNWSTTNLLEQHGDWALEEARVFFPFMRAVPYTACEEELPFWLERELAETDVVIVHEWSEPDLVRAVAAMSQNGRRVRLFHDTHYRAYSDPDLWHTLDLHRYDGILAYSPSLAELYTCEYGLDPAQVHIFHEAADVDWFKPLAAEDVLRDRATIPPADVVFIGNWGDDDRNEIMEDYFVAPAVALPQYRWSLYGARYPEAVLRMLHKDTPVAFQGWVPNYRTPHIYASAKLTLHLPRRQYLEVLPGTPTIRMFEALACGICLVSLPWQDTDRLFTAEKDYLTAATPAEMAHTIARLLDDDAERAAIAAHGLATVRARHTCRHRVEQLLQIIAAH